MKLRTAILTALLSLATYLPAQAPQALPSAKEVIAKAIERGKAESKLNNDAQYGWTQIVTEEKLGKDGKVEERKQTEYEPVRLLGRRFLRVHKVNGRPPTGDELKKANEREKKFRESVADEQKKKKNDDDDDVEINEELVNRFQFTVVGKEMVNGRSSYVLTFLPKTGVKLPEKKRMDRLLNRLEGRVWLDAELYSIMKVDMALTEPTTLMAGLGSVRELEWKIELFPVEPGIFMPKSMAVKVDGRRLFSSMRVRQQVEFSNYRKLSQLAEMK